MAAETSLRTHDVMRLVHLDAREKLLSSEPICLCVTCETCVAHCPNQCDPARTIDALRAIAVAESHAIPRTIAAFHRSLLDQVRLTGRMFELGLVVEYKRRSGALVAEVTAVPGTLARGKLSFVPHAIEGVEEVHRILEACNTSGEEDP